MRRKKVKKQMYQLKRAFEENKLATIGKLAHKSPTEFWKAIKALMRNTKDNKANAISPKIWTKYFKKLLNTKNVKSTNEKRLLQTAIDVPFTNEEIKRNLSECKNGKSSTTSITYEMLKADTGLILPYLQHMFNTVLTSNKYPKLWCLSYLVPIFKTGDVTEPSNYRGIAIGNHISKLFAKCINKRIETYLSQHHVLPDNSLGFRKNIRTEDAMFLLKTTAQKYNKLGKRLYTIFVDFSKFYDTIDHYILLEKLYNIGITGNIFHVIRNMYSNVLYSIKFNNEGEVRLTQYFQSNIGLKQGCPLSPTLANIFLYDIHINLVIRDVEIEGQFFNSISWADDLVLFSLSHEEAQAILDKLYEYCKQMKLQVNIDKTKAMIISKGCVPSTKVENFIFDNHYLTFVNSYKYLGIEFQQNGKFKNAIQTRIQKAQNASFVIRQACSADNISSVELYRKLYEAKIFPILLYGSAIWGTATNNRLVITKKDPTSSTRIRDMIEEQNKKGTHLSDLRLSKTIPGQATILCSTYEEKLTTLSNVTLRNYLNIKSYQPDPEKSDVETFLNKHIKRILGVKKGCNNAIARMHIGWIPMYLKIYIRCIKYWCRTIEGTSNKLLNAAYSHARKFKTQWEQGIQNILISNGLQCIYNNPPTNVKDIRRIVFQRLYDSFYQNLETKINESKKLNDFTKYCEITHSLPKFMTQIVDPRHRTTITKLRTHTHCLQTETGSYIQNEEPSKYVCKLCNANKPEDPYHFIFHCTWKEIKGPRDNLLAYIYKCRPDLKYKPKELTLSVLLECKFDSLESSQIQIIYQRLHKMYHLREKHPPI